MSQSQRKVVAELSKVWESVVAKGKSSPIVKNWLPDNSTVASVQSVISENVAKMENFSRETAISADFMMNEAKTKANRLMSAYEELIGIREVRTAHERVLSMEAKFIECQEERRAASKQLAEIQNKLVEIRAELDRTQRGDELYLDLIKKEILATKEERIIRKTFEDWERTEREVFSTLSSALRFSHEKERAQNEKTKYWSIMGSLIGATLGILGTTVNNRIRQSHMKRVLEETSLQVAAIESTVNSLTTKVNEGTLTTQEISHLVNSLKEHENELRKQEKLTSSMNEAVQLLNKVLVTYGESEKVIPLNEIGPINNSKGDLRSLVVDNKWPVAAILGCLMSLWMYKLS